MDRLFCLNPLAAAVKRCVCVLYVSGVCLYEKGGGISYKGYVCLFLLRPQALPAYSKQPLDPF